MPWNDGLDPATVAYQIAADASRRVRVLAGPGTGKSYAIKRRVTRLLEEGVAPRTILAVTFTRMSAADLVRDIRSLGIAGADEVRSRTLHSECFRILGRNDVIAITARHPRPLSAFEFEPMLADLRVSASGRDKRQMRKLVAAYESAWARLQHENPGAPLTPEDQQFEDGLIDWLKFHRAMLIGELVPFAYKYLRDNPAAPERSAYAHVLVDEYQDLNKAEQEVASQLATAGHLIIVGDDDQSIYTFKNAHRVGIIDFPAAHAGTNDHTMDECRRCPRLVVSMANSLIAHNRTRSAPPRSLTPSLANGEGEVQIAHFATHAAETNYLADRIESFINHDGISPGQIIVLCQSREYIRRLKQLLDAKELPNEFCFQESQLDDENARERMAMLNFAASQEDRVALRFLLGFGSNDWRTNQWTQIRDFCEAERKSPVQVLEEMVAGTRSATGFNTILTRFRAIQAETNALSSQVGAALLAGWLPDASNCLELRDLAQSVVDASPDCDAKKLSETVLELITEPDIPDVVADVRIMSLHKSKGLSANVVIIAGCVEGLIPRKQDDELSDMEQAEAIEESRRLLFVGLTRVKSSPHEGRPGHLIMSASRTVPTAIAMRSGISIAGREGGASRTITSRFLGELGPDCPVPQAPAS